MRRMYSLEQLKGIADSRVQALIEGGTLENAKPIYYHPIFARDYDISARLTFVILDNSNTEYTWATLKTKIKELMDDGAMIQCNGFYMNNGVCFNAFIILKEGENAYTIYGNDYEGNQNGLSLDDLNVSVFNDGVNKIN